MGIEFGKEVITPQSTGAVAPDLDAQTFTQSVDNSSTGATSPGGPVVAYLPGFSAAPEPVAVEEAAPTTKVIKPKSKPAAKPSGKPVQTK
jgi:hypothetical protein